MVLDGQSRRRQRSKEEAAGGTAGRGSRAGQCGAGRRAFPGASPSCLPEDCDQQPSRLRPFVFGLGPGVEGKSPSPSWGRAWDGAHRGDRPRIPVPTLPPGQLVGFRFFERLSPASPAPFAPHPHSPAHTYPRRICRGKRLAGIPGHATPGGRHPWPPAAPSLRKGGPESRALRPQTGARGRKRCAPGLPSQVVVEPGQEAG